MSKFRFIYEPLSYNIDSNESTCLEIAYQLKRIADALEVKNE
jgi:hypothetical protein